MAVELEHLYAELDPKHEVTLLTESCFHKMIGWIHMVEDMDFVPLLHGDELVFNSGLNYVSEKWLKNYIEALNQKNAGGLMIALREGKTIPQEIIDYCNAIEFALFSATWATPYIDVMRIFSVILLKNEQRDTNLNAALKNAIFFPENEQLYLGQFESNGYFDDMNYNIIILSCNAYSTEKGNENLSMIKKKIRHLMQRGIVWEEKERLIILATGYSENRMIDAFQKLCEKDANIYVGIGTNVNRIRDIHISYERAYTAYQLTKTPIPKNMLCYKDLGIYKILSNVKEKEIYLEFVNETLGLLIEYDRKNQTDYVNILTVYFENECSIIHAAEKLFCHKNTVGYKINKIKEILGYDISTNENRMKIMICIHIMKVGTGNF